MKMTAENWRQVTKRIIINNTFNDDRENREVMETFAAVPVAAIEPAIAYVEAENRARSK